MNTKEARERLREIDEAMVMLNSRVPRRDYDAAVDALKVCQTTIETLTTELYALHPHSVAVGDARTILAGLEAIINTQFSEWTADKIHDGIFKMVKKS